MTAERPLAMNKGAQLAEQLLNNRDTLRILSAGGPKKEEILKDIVYKLGYDVVSQANFLIMLFESMTTEGDFDVTNRRDGALAILTDTRDGNVRITPVMKILVRNESAPVYSAYLNAVRKQTKENDPISGSIDTLLDAGSALVRCIDLSGRGQKKENILNAWQSVTVGFTDPKEQSHIHLKLRDIEVGMAHPFVELDDQVEQLRNNKSLSYPKIAQQLGESQSDIEASVRRLQAAGKIEKRTKRRNS